MACFVELHVITWLLHPLENSVDLFHSMKILLPEYFQTISRIFPCHGKDFHTMNWTKLWNWIFQPLSAIFPNAQSPVPNYKASQSLQTFSSVFVFDFVCLFVRSFVYTLCNDRSILSVSGKMFNSVGIF